MMDLTSEEKHAMIVIPKFSGALSFIGSFYIIAKILLTKRRRKRIHSRLLVGMSILAILQSTAVLFSQWAFDADEIYLTRCAVKKSLYSCGIGAAIYNSIISIYYLLIVKYSYTEQYMKKLEISLHSIPYLWTIISVILTVTMYQTGEEESCGGLGDISTDNINLFQKIHIAFGLTTILICLIVGTFCMLSLYHSVRTKEKKNEKYRHGQEHSTNKKSNLVKRQALIYLGSVYLTWLLVVINMLREITGANSYRAEAIFYILQSFLVHLQGALNVFVYMRQKITLCSEKKNELKGRNDSTASIGPENFIPQRRRSKLSLLFQKSADSIRRSSFVQALNSNLSRSTRSRSRSRRGSGQKSEKIENDSYVPREATRNSFNRALEQEKQNPIDYVHEDLIEDLSESLNSSNAMNVITESNELNDDLFSAHAFEDDEPITITIHHYPDDEEAQNQDETKTKEDKRLSLMSQLTLDLSSVDSQASIEKSLDNYTHDPCDKSLDDIIQDEESSTKKYLDQEIENHKLPISPNPPKEISLSNSNHSCESFTPLICPNTPRPSNEIAA